MESRCFGYRHWDALFGHRDNISPAYSRQLDHLGKLYTAESSDNEDVSDDPLEQEFHNEMILGSDDECLPTPNKTPKAAPIADCSRSFNPPTSVPIADTTQPLNIPAENYTPTRSRPRSSRHFHVRKRDIADVYMEMKLQDLESKELHRKEEYLISNVT